PRLAVQAVVVQLQVFAGGRDGVGVHGAVDAQGAEVEDRADPGTGVGRVGRLGVHVDDEEVAQVAQGQEAAVLGGVALGVADVGDGDGEGPGAGDLVGDDVEPVERPGPAAGEDDLVGVSGAGAPALVVVAPARHVARRAELDLVGGAVQVQLPRGAAVFCAVLDVDQAAVGVPGLVELVVVAGVAAPDAAAGGGQGRAGVAGDAGDLGAE